MRRKFLWLTDTHLYLWQRYGILHTIKTANPQGVFITGDISNGITLIGDLEFLAKRLDIPIYFILGNHDIWFSSIENIHKKLKKLCSEYKNLLWLDQEKAIELNKETGLIGCTGWYDGRVGNPDFIKFTFDWFMIKEFRELSWNKRFEKFKELADNDTEIVIEKIEAALDLYKTVFLMTHFVPWREGNRYSNFLNEAFWQPYNTNLKLGKSLEKIMEKHKKRNLIVYAGHTHTPLQIHISRNIECRVGKGGHLNNEIIYV